MNFKNMAENLINLENKIIVENGKIHEENLLSLCLYTVSIAKRYLEAVKLLILYGTELNASGNCEYYPPEVEKFLKEHEGN